MGTPRRAREARFVGRIGAGENGIFVSLGLLARQDGGQVEHAAGLS
jgi:hypothetical protein|tara:strand:+ start:5412 stop:5549 length:138 start_codon:yes stop_codon:yes gene_type:complete